MEQGLFIYPLNLGVLEIEKSLLTFHCNYGMKTKAACIGWAIQGGEKNILVETGPSDAERAARYHWPLTKDSSQEIAEALREIGWSCSDVQIIVLTHLHWDHCYFLEFFPNAKIYVQISELQFAEAPLPHMRKTYEVGLAQHIQPPWTKVMDRLIPIEGYVEILSGVRTIKLPGHTPGSQGIIVETHDGPWVIAGDAVPLYDNLKGNEVYPIIPSGIYLNISEYYESLRRLEPYRGRILPAHDEAVLAQRRYPWS